MNLAAPKAEQNDTQRAGQRASRSRVSGEFSRFATFAVHTRFEAVQWFTTDAETLDALGMPSVIRQAASFGEAVATLGGGR